VADDHSAYEGPNRFATDCVGHPDMASLVAAPDRPAASTAERPRRMRGHHKPPGMALPVGNAGHPAIADGQAGGVRLVGVVEPVLGRQLPNRSPILRSLEPRGFGFAHAALTAGEVHVDLVFAVWRARQRSVTTERAAAEDL